MRRLEGRARERYVRAWERWRADIEALHRVLLDGETMDPLHFVALLRRESKSKAQYEAARVEVLGLPADDAGPFAMPEPGTAEEGQGATI
jgi:hypothetical protein